MAALEAAIQSARVCAPEDSGILLDGRVKPGHDEKSEVVGTIQAPKPVTPQGAHLRCLGAIPGAGPGTGKA